MNNIENIVKERTCTGCGTCYSICPVSCIAIEENVKEGIFLPSIDMEKCTDCGLCIKVCPQTDLIKNEFLNKEQFYGKSLLNFYGYSENKNIRYDSSSGGLITSLAIFSLKNRLVDGVIAVRSKSDNPLRFESIICRTEEDILSSRGSKYCPVSVNTILKNIVEEDKKESTYMFIGLPCHLKGLDKFTSIYPELENKIKYKMALFCSHISNYHGTEFILKKWRISLTNVNKLRYRGNGWPGAMSIIEKNGQETSIYSGTYWGKYFANYFFTPKYCFLCDDFFGLESDISFGDAWLDKFNEDKEGVSLGIVRSDKGKKLMMECKENKAIFFDELSKKEIEKSQYGQVLFKNILFPDRKRVLLKLPLRQKIHLSFKCYNKFMIFNSYLSGKKMFKSLLIIFPDFIEKLYFKILNKIKTLLMKKNSSL
ncbi:MAG: Coenzyme F420 hydrogenase/dehydrogenase, beta subunit C-terminal domain [Candidatus Aureabacteria bacterium]|nr:Coenzyme F420 hydrogenase/dehydrogenase, beta subunit C-terminal domain [Candidatus Auribacterota bacterium]